MEKLIKWIQILCDELLQINYYSKSEIMKSPVSQTNPNTLQITSKCAQKTNSRQNGKLEFFRRFLLFSYQTLQIHCMSGIPQFIHECTNAILFFIFQSILPSTHIFATNSLVHLYI